MAGLQTLEPFVDVDTVAAYLGFHPVTVRRMAAAGSLRCHRYGLGKRTFFRFRLSELDNPQPVHLTSPKLSAQKEISA